MPELELEEENGIKTITIGEHIKIKLNREQKIIVDKWADKIEDIETEFEISFPDGSRGVESDVKRVLSRVLAEAIVEKLYKSKTSEQKQEVVGTLTVNIMQYMGGGIRHSIIFDPLKRPGKIKSQTPKMTRTLVDRRSVRSTNTSPRKTSLSSQNSSTPQSQLGLDRPSIYQNLANQIYGRGLNGNSPHSGILQFGSNGSSFDTIASPQKQKLEELKTKQGTRKTREERLEELRRIKEDKEQKKLAAEQSVIPLDLEQPDNFFAKLSSSQRLDTSPIREIGDLKEYEPLNSNLFQETIESSQVGLVEPVAPSSEMESTREEAELVPPLPEAEPLKKRLPQEVEERGANLDVATAEEVNRSEQSMERQETGEIPQEPAEQLALVPNIEPVLTVDEPKLQNVQGNHESSSSNKDVSETLYSGDVPAPESRPEEEMEQSVPTVELMMGAKNELSQESAHGLEDNSVDEKPTESAVLVQRSAEQGTILDNNSAIQDQQQTQPAGELEILKAVAGELLEEPMLASMPQGLAPESAEAGLAQRMDGQEADQPRQSAEGQQTDGTREPVEEVLAEQDTNKTPQKLETSVQADGDSQVNEGLGQSAQGTTTQSGQEDFDEEESTVPAEPLQEIAQGNQGEEDSTIEEGGSQQEQRVSTAEPDGVVAASMSEVESTQEIEGQNDDPDAAFEEEKQYQGRSTPPVPPASLADLVQEEELSEAEAGSTQEVGDEEIVVGGDASNQSEQVVEEGVDEVLQESLKHTEQPVLEPLKREQAEWSALVLNSVEREPLHAIEEQKTDVDSAVGDDGEQPKQPAEGQRADEILQENGQEISSNDVSKGSESVQTADEQGVASVQYQPVEKPAVLEVSTGEPLIGLAQGAENELNEDKGDSDDNGNDPETIFGGDGGVPKNINEEQKQQPGQPTEGVAASQTQESNGQKVYSNATDAREDKQSEGQQAGGIPQEPMKPEQEEGEPEISSNDTTRKPRPAQEAEEQKEAVGSSFKEKQSVPAVQNEPVSVANTALPTRSIGASLDIAQTVPVVSEEKGNTDTEERDAETDKITDISVKFLDKDSKGSEREEKTDIQEVTDGQAIIGAAMLRGSMMEEVNLDGKALAKFKNVVEEASRKDARGDMNKVMNNTELFNEFSEEKLGYDSGVMAVAAPNGKGQYIVHAISMGNHNMKEEPFAIDITLGSGANMRKYSWHLPSQEAFVFDDKGVEQPIKPGSKDYDRLMGAVKLPEREEVLKQDKFGKKELLFEKKDLVDVLKKNIKSEDPNVTLTSDMVKAVNNICDIIGTKEGLTEKLEAVIKTALNNQVINSENKSEMSQVILNSINNMSRERIKDIIRKFDKEGAASSKRLQLEESRKRSENELSSYVSQK